MSLKLASNMSSQLAVNIKSAKVSFKSVLELLYKKDPDMVDRLISELQVSKTKPESKTDKSPMTQEEKDARKQSREDKKQHIDQFILDNGGLEAVSEKQIADEKKKYDKKKRENKSVETTNVDTPKAESNDFVEASEPSELVMTSEPVPESDTESCNDFVVEETSDVEKKKVEKKKKEKRSNMPDEKAESEPESDTESCNDFVVEESELEEDTSDVEKKKVEKKKVEKKKVEKEKVEKEKVEKEKVEKKKVEKEKVEKKKVEKKKEKVEKKKKEKKSKIPETSSDSE